MPTSSPQPGGAAHWAVGSSVPSSHDNKPPTEALGPTLCCLGCGRLGLCPVTGAMEEQPPETQERTLQKRQKKRAGGPGEHLLSPPQERQALGESSSPARGRRSERRGSVESGAHSAGLTPGSASPRLGTRSKCRVSSPGDGDDDGPHPAGWWWDSAEAMALRTWRRGRRGPSDTPLHLQSEFCT